LSGSVEGVMGNHDSYSDSSLRFSSFRKVTVEGADAESEEHGCKRCPLRFLQF
jgi:hypothetical protein